MAYPAYGYPAAGGLPGGMSYFFIRSRLNGLVLDIEGGNRAPGARVVLWNQKPVDNDNQLWYDDLPTGTIRSKLTGFCLDLAGDTLVVNPLYPGNTNQHWMRADPYIQSRINPNRVIDVADNNRSPGARLIAYNRNGGANQMFDFQYHGAAPGYPVGPAYPTAVPAYPAGPAYPAAVPAYPAGPSLTITVGRSTPAQPVFAPSRRFLIVSLMNGKVLDIEGANRSPGAHVIVWQRQNSQNQLWYLDGQGVIRSCLNDFALEAKSDGDKVKMMPYRGKKKQMWMVSGNRIVRDHKNCLDIEGCQQHDGAKVIQWDYKGSVNQHWRIEYV